MTEQERENLKRRFEAIAKQLDGIVDMLLILENENELLSQNDMYIDLLGSARAAEDASKCLADYIGHASDENWKQAL